MGNGAKKLRHSTIYIDLEKETKTNSNKKPPKPRKDESPTKPSSVKGGKKPLVHIALNA